MKKFFKLLFSAYFVIVVPYILSLCLTRFIVNNGILSNDQGRTDGLVAIYLFLAFYIIDQIAAVVIVQKFLFKRKENDRCKTKCCK